MVYLFNNMNGCIYRCDKKHKHPIKENLDIKNIELFSDDPNDQQSLGMKITTRSKLNSGIYTIYARNRSGEFVELKRIDLKNNDSNIIIIKQVNYKSVMRDIFAYTKYYIKDDTNNNTGKIYCFAFNPGYTCN